MRKTKDNKRLTRYSYIWDTEENKGLTRYRGHRRKQRTTKDSPDIAIYGTLKKTKNSPDIGDTKESPNTPSTTATVKLYHPEIIFETFFKTEGHDMAHHHLKKKVAKKITI